MCAGFTDDARAVVVFAVFTTSWRECDVLGLNVFEPWYTAMIECEPAASDDTGIEAVPFVRVALPRPAGPSKRSTTPAGVPEEELTTAVKETNCPKTDGFGAETSV